MNDVFSVFSSAMGGLNFAPGIESAGRARQVPEPVNLAFGSGDVVELQAPAGPWAWMNGMRFTVERFYGSAAWAYRYEAEEGGKIKKEYLIPLEYVRAVKA